MRSNFCNDAESLVCVMPFTLHAQYMTVVVYDVVRQIDRLSQGSFASYQLPPHRVARMRKWNTLSREFLSVRATNDDVCANCLSTV